MTVSVVLAMAVAIIFLRVAGSSSMRLPGLAVFLMIRQLADFMTLAGTEEHEGGGKREDHEVADNGTHRRETTHPILFGARVFGDRATSSPNLRRDGIQPLTA